MKSVRLHVDGNGVTWVMAKCRGCGEVHKYVVSEVLAGPVACKGCAHPMEIEGAVVEAALPSDRTL
jgi:hypothetical protein